MRDLKFRAWFKTKPIWCNQMFYSDEESPGLGDWFSECEIEEDGITFLQFTGLKDNNGKEIYDGDVLRCDQWTKHIMAEIKWDVESVRFRMASNDHSQFIWEDFESWIFKGNILTNFEIIGNIKENPELLEIGVRG